MAHKPEVIRAVRAAYAHDRLTLPQAAERNGVPIGTVRRWKALALKAGDSWDKARAASSMSSKNMDEVLSAMVNDFVILHQGLVEEITKAEDMDATSKVSALNSLADSFSKFMASAGKVNPKMNKLSLAMDLVQFLGSFITTNFPQHASAFAEIIEPFGQDVANRYG